jgi:hypothetical protein
MGLAPRAPRKPQSSVTPKPVKPCGQKTAFGPPCIRPSGRFVLGNLEAALNEEPRPGGRRKLSDKDEALLVATACSNPPSGRARWTLELLAGELVKLAEHVAAISCSGAQ